ncbi:hypothetical protein IW147_003767 [Coemansia sp. RSA 720]|nr:hypothetical protein IW147_003767 [Coemansia sp. RSA 720]
MVVRHVGFAVKSIIGNSGDSAEKDRLCTAGDSDIFEVLYPYSPVESDELAITPGEKIRVLRVFSDGWAFVQRVDDGKIGAIPAVCLDASL